MPALALLLYYAVEAYILLIFVYVLGSWFPQWRYQQWFRTIDGLVAPYLNLFRGLRLQFGMVDLTPMLAIFVLALVQMALRGLAASGGL